MQSWKRVAVYVGAGIILLVLAACSKAPIGTDEAQPLDPSRYVGTWTHQSGTALEKLVLTEDSWLFVKGDTLDFPYGRQAFVYYQGGRGSLTAHATQIDLTLDAVWAPSDSASFSWFAKGTPTYEARALFEQKTLPFGITDTEITLDLGWGPQTYVRQ